jgi:hypothetical protein
MKGVHMSTNPSDLQSQVEELKTAMAVQEANMAGQAATDAATHAGTWSTFLAAGVALCAGMFLAAALVAVRAR